MTYNEARQWFYGFLKKNDTDMLNFLITQKEAFGELPIIEYTHKKFSIRFDNIKQTVTMIKLGDNNGE